MNINTDSLHHAYLLEGDISYTRNQVRDFLKNKLEMDVLGNADVRDEHIDTLTIDKAREIATAQQRKSFNSRYVFVLSFAQATTEAQNALLKTFEEPAVDTHFFVIVPSVSVLIPTLQSRLVYVESGIGDSEEKDTVAKFIKSSTKERMDIVGGLLEEKRKERYVAFVQELQRCIYDSHKKSRDTKNIHNLELTHNTLSYLSDRGASPKILLERLAVSFENMV